MSYSIPDLSEFLYIPEIESALECLVAEKRQQNKKYNNLQKINNPNYMKNKIRAARKWEKNNPEKVKQIQKKSWTKYSKNNSQHLKNYRQKWGKENSEKLKNNKLLFKYGITLNQLKEMEKQQSDKCVICNYVGKLQIDHCHSSGKIRGLLCGYCNKGLGNFKDNIANLEKAIEYLKCQS